MRRIRTLPGTTLAAIFFVLTYTITWLAWIPLTLSGQAPSKGVLAVGGIAPSLVGILMVYLTMDGAHRRDFWVRVVDARRIGRRWYGVIFLLPPLALALTFLLHRLLGGSLPSFDEALRTLSQPALLFDLIISELIGGPLAEELGWRGFALDRLQSRWSALRSSVILALAWAPWHLPLFFLAGTSQAEFGLAPLPILRFVVWVLSVTVILTWVYNNTRRSILAVILAHFMMNFTPTLIVGFGHAFPQQVEVINTVVLALIALVIATRWQIAGTKGNRSSAGAGPVAVKPGAPVSA